MSIYRGAGGASDSVDDATVNAVAAYAADAASSATAAAASAVTAETAASSTSGSVAAVATSATNAATSASNASISASNAATSASNASASQTAASASALAASVSAFEAAASALGADTSEANAAASAVSASTYATNSANSAASALAIYVNTTVMNDAVYAASNSASNAATSAYNSSLSASTSATQAANAANSAIAADSSKSSALIYANNASISASNAATSAANAATSASAAATSATNSAAVYGGLSAVNTAVATTTTNANNAATSASNAATSATQAAASAASASAIVLGTASSLPSIRPTLNLDFANSAVIDPRITFTRASTATYYDGKTTAKAEENLILQSQTFDSWTLNNSSVSSNTSVAPDSTSTADTLTASATTAFHAVVRNVSIPISGVTYQVSVYAKVGTASLMQFFSNNGLNATDRVNFDLSAGTVTTASGAYSGASIVSVGNGWYRCIIPITSVSTVASGIYFAITDSSTASRANSWAAAGTETILLWGAQVEQRSSVTAYTPTTTQEITNYIPVLQTAASGVARLDYDPVTFAAKGLLIEESRTNVLLYSSTFTNAVWAGTNITLTSNTAIAPDGTLTAANIAPTSTSGSHSFINTVSVAVSIGNTFSASIYVKPNGYNYVGLGIGGTGYAGEVLAVFNLTTGQLTASDNATSATVVAYSSTNVGNGWWRLSITSTATAVDATPSVRVYVSNDGTINAGGGGVPSFAGNGYSGLYIWGAQFELGAFPTSHIPTTSAQVTRAADIASFSTLTSWYNPSEGAFVVKYVPNDPTPSGARGLFIVDDGTGTNAVGMVYTTTLKGILNIVTNNTGGGATTANSGTVNQVNILSGAYKVNDYAVTLNGSTVATSTTLTLPTVTQARIGLSLRTGLYANAAIGSITYYPKRVSNTELQALTA